MLHFISRMVRFLGVAIVVMLAGCSGIMPSFDDGPFVAGYSYGMPVDRVKEQLACELRSFVGSEKYKQFTEKFLNPNGKFIELTVSLTMQTDGSGSVGYLGFDLKKLGLDGLAHFVATGKTGPSLGATVKWKGTTKSTVVFKIFPDKIPGYFTKVQPILATFGTKPTTATDFCFARLHSFDNELSPDNHLFLVKWLKDYVDKVGVSALMSPPDITEVTLEKQFMIGVDISTGVNPILDSATFLLPISGLNLGVSPQYTHSLKLTFAPQKG